MGNTFNLILMSLFAISCGKNEAVYTPDDTEVSYPSMICRPVKNAPSYTLCKSPDEQYECLIAPSGMTGCYYVNEEQY